MGKVGGRGAVQKVAKEKGKENKLWWRIEEVRYIFHLFLVAFIRDKKGGNFN
jgi:hypothetical protein